MNRVIVSGMVGNALEWFDYALYAQFADVIGRTFFNGADPSSHANNANNGGVLANVNASSSSSSSSNNVYIEYLTYAVFALGFIVRPVGALVFSAIGDRFGRKAALSLGILCMAVPTAGIGLLPSYETMGILSPLILCLLRIMQGLALGGEFSVCISYLVEHSEKGQRGLVGSASFVSMCIGMLVGSITVYLMRRYLDPVALDTYLWRAPFISGLLIGLVGVYIRMRLTESPVYLKAKELDEKLTKSSGVSSQWEMILLVVRSYSKPVLVSMAIYLTVTVPFYILTVYVEQFLKKENILISDSNSNSSSNNASIGSGGGGGGNSLTPVEASCVTAVGLCVLIGVMPLSSYVSDKVGRRPVLITGAALLSLGIFPVFLVFQKKILFGCLVAQAFYAAALGIYMGPVPTVLVEIFPTHTRLTGVALSYNLCAALFGGTAPMVAMYLVNTCSFGFGVLVVGAYISALSILSLYVLAYHFEESYMKDL